MIPQSTNCLFAYVGTLCKISKLKLFHLWSDHLLSCRMGREATFKTSRRQLVECQSKALTINFRVSSGNTVPSKLDGARWRPIIESTISDKSSERTPLFECSTIGRRLALRLRWYLKTFPISMTQKWDRKSRFHCQIRIHALQLEQCLHLLSL